MKKNTKSLRYCSAKLLKISRLRRAVLQQCITLCTSQMIPVGLAQTSRAFSEWQSRIPIPVEHWDSRHRGLLLFLRMTETRSCNRKNIRDRAYANQEWFCEQQRHLPVTAKTQRSAATRILKMVCQWQRCLPTPVKKPTTVYSQFEILQKMFLQTMLLV